MIHIRIRERIRESLNKSSRKKKKKKDTEKKAEYISKTFFYYAISDGDKRCYTEADRTKGYGAQSIPCPKTVTFSQVFVNGVLQPSTLYNIEKGSLTLTSKDVPEKGVPIILQSILIFKRRKGVK